MQPVLRRIALHGALTALLLGVIGFMFAELASIWLAASPGTRAATGAPIDSPDADGAIAAKLRNRVPLLMAMWGFGFVAVGEFVLHFWRSRRKSNLVSVSSPNESEQHLAELLREVDAKATIPDAAVASSTALSENTPCTRPIPPPGEQGA